MIGFIVSGHGRFASGISASVELIMGETSHYEMVDFQYGETASELEKNIDDAINRLKDCEEIIAFTDLLSGSPLNMLSMASFKDERIHVIYGTNLAMLIESILKRNMGASCEEIIESAIENGKQQIGVFRKALIDADEFDE